MTNPLGLATAPSTNRMASKPFCPPSYDMTHMKQVIAVAQTLTQDEATQVTRYILGRYGHRSPRPGQSPEQHAAGLAWRLYQSMASMADKKNRLGIAVADQITEAANTQYMGSIFNHQDQVHALKDLIAENPMVLVELAKGLIGNESGDIAKFLLHWQWKAHNTGEPTGGLPSWTQPGKTQHTVAARQGTPTAVDPQYWYYRGLAA